MSRHLLAGFVLVAEVALLWGARGGEPPVWAVAGYGLAVAALIVLRHRSPAAAFAGAMGLSLLGGAGYVLLLWASYQAGRAVVTRWGAATVVVAAIVPPVVRIGDGPVRVIVTYLVFTALPLLAGRYVAQHERLVAALESSNRRLRRERELLAERERLRERLRIARDMHDSLGHRLSLVSIQAAALEVTPLPPGHAASVRRLAAAARDAIDELHDLVGALRGDEDAAGRGVADVPALIAGHRAAGTTITLREEGAPRPLPAAAGHAAYRVIEEGLTNAAKHAPAQPVTITLDWETDALLINIANPATGSPEACAAGSAGEGVPAAGTGSRAGHGLRGLRERVEPLGGLIDHRLSDGTFRLFAMLPLTHAAWSHTPADVSPHRSPDAVVPSEPPHRETRGVSGRGLSSRVVGAAVGVLLFVVLPGVLMLGTG